MSTKTPDDVTDTVLEKAGLENTELEKGAAEDSGTTGGDTGGEIPRLLVKAGHLTEAQLRYAERVRSKLPSAKTMLMVLRELKLVTEEQVRTTLHQHRVSLRFGTLLVELGYLRDTDLRTALALQKERPGKKLGEVMVESHMLTRDQLIEVLSLQLGFPHVSDELDELDRSLVRRAPVRWYEEHRMIPVRLEGEGVLVAFEDPLDQNAVDTARKVFGEKMIVAIVRDSALDAAIALVREADGANGAVVTETNEVVALVNEMLDHAAEEGASDVHIEPMKDRLRIRMRQDGVLVPFRELPKEMAAPLASRIKVLAGADIAERRRHQDGRILFERREGALDLRVSFYSTIHGEKIVLRLLNNRSVLLDINDIGMAPRMLDRFREDVLEAPSGVVIVTGPTGSGKTTTLYGSINYLNNVNTSITTAEDPVEYMIDGISQCSINPKISVTYEETLRHIVRQDPDVIVIGEIRDRFSAETAIQAALTGHKVLTTFHTEDSIGGLLRLLNMDIEAFLISSTVVCVVAQRLVRRVCPSCSEPHMLSPDEMRRLGYNPAETGALTFAKGRGCGECRYMGYKGRVAIFELLVLNELVKDALINRKTSYEIRRISTETSGLVTLVEDGILKASRGLTSFDELIRRLPRLDQPRSLQELRRLQGEF